MTTSLEVRTDFNAGDYPVVDRHGRAFTPNCRVRFRLPSYYINTAAGAGALKSIDKFGGCYVLSDTPLDVHDRNGAIVERRREVYAPIADYLGSGPLRGKRVTQRRLGDRHEHGVTECFIELEI